MLRFSNLLHLHRVRLRSSWVQELLAISGIAVGVALIFAALVANASLSGSMREVTEGIVGDARVQLVSRGPDGFDERLLSAVRRVDGVDGAAPVVEARANLVGPAGDRSVLLIGGDHRFAQLGGPLLRPFLLSSRDQTEALQEQGVVAVPSSLAESVGISFTAPIELEVGDRRVDVPLAIQLQGGEIGAVANSPIVLGALEYVQRVSGMSDRVTRVFVKPEPGRHGDVAAALRRIGDGRLNVLPADADVAVFERSAYPTRQSTALFSGLSALVGFLFAFSSVLLTVPHRRALIADLRQAGHGVPAVVQMLLFDALVLGVAGSAVGLGLGEGISRLIFDDIPDYLSFTFSIGLDRAVTWESVAVAGGAGLAAACFAVLVPLRDAFLAPGEGPERGGQGGAGMTLAAFAGAACVAVATAVVVAAPDAAMVGLLALTCGLMLLLPLLLKGATAGFGLLTQRWNSSVPTFAAIELRATASRPRTLAIAATGALALFATVSIVGARADLQRGLDASTRDTVGNADVWVTFPDAPNVLATTPFPAPPERIAAIESVSGVRAVREYRGSLLDVGDRRAWVLAPPADAPRIVPPSQIKQGNVRRAAARLRRGGWVVLSEGIAEATGVGIGDPVTLPSPVPSTLRVAAISTNLGWSPGAILLNADDYARAWATSDTTALHVDVRSGVPLEDVEFAIERTLGLDVPLKVETMRERIAVHYAASRDGLSRLSDIAIVVVVAAIVAMAIAMGGMIWQRRRGIAALKVHGYSEAKLWRALLLESGVQLGTGCVAGAAFGLYGQILLSRALETITGFPVFYSVAAVPAVTILALVTAVALAMLAVPGWMAVRVPPEPGIPR